MPRCYWRGEWYVYNHVRREFLVWIGCMGKQDAKHPKAPRVQWSSLVAKARAYRDPDAAQKAASRINADPYRKNGPSWPCQPVSVVTGEAARCLDIINRREKTRKY